MSIARVLRAVGLPVGNMGRGGGTSYQAAQTAAQLAATQRVWGKDAWRYDKGAFRQWVKASNVRHSHEERQMYAFLGASFGDCDVDKDGFLNQEEFDLLLEMVAQLPRRFGFAPSWRAEYGTKAARAAARKGIFNSIDGSGGHKARGKITMSQFIQWVKPHIAGQSPKLNQTDGDVALRHIGKYTVDEYLAFLDEAVNNPDSFQAAGFYNYLLTCFVEADEECKAVIDFSAFNKLIDVASKTPKFFELAPAEQDEEERMKLFKHMDSTNSGFITFRKFLQFTRQHTKAKLQARR